MFQTEKHYRTLEKYNDNSVNSLSELQCTSDNDCKAAGNACTVDTCDTLAKNCVNTPTFSKTCRTVGKPKVFALRIIAQDVQTTASVSDLQNYIFGSAGKELTMKSQFSACSDGQLDLQPYDGNTVTNKVITNGVDELQISMNVAGIATGVVVQKVVEAATIKYGDLPSQFDFLMLCLPPKTKIGTSLDWKAYAYVNSYQSIYNDENCKYPSIQMHELGHNLGLSHSNDDKNYGDETGVMGISYKKLEVPKKCFNAPKTSQLNWFSDSILTLKPEDLHAGGTYYDLIGFAHYNQRSSSHKTILRFINGNDGYDYYVSYNSIENMNSGSGEGQNKVLVARRQSGLFYADSFLLARLKDYDSYVVLNFKDELSIKIRATIFTDGEPPYARIYVYGRTAGSKSGNFCDSNNDCNDLSSCTVDTCQNEVCTFTPKSCSECGSMVSIIVTANEHPDHVLWTLQDINSARIVRSSGYFAEKNKTYTNSKCLEYGKYKFSISYTGPNATTTNTTFQLSVGNEKIFNDTISEAGYMENAFTICSANDQCLDYDGCTTDLCNMGTKLCDNTRKEDSACVNCAWMALNITTDNFPEETRWNLNTLPSNQFVLSGDPYPLFTVGFGRRKAPTKAGRRKAPTRSNTSTKHHQRQLQIYTNNLDKKHRALSNGANVGERICLEKGYLYQFLIADTFGDGICCDEGNGNYFIRVNDIEIKRGGNFESSEDISFKFMSCTTNLDCNDNSLCSSDVCRSEISTCIYTTMPCQECGKMVNVTFLSDWSPQQNSWNITKNNVTQVLQAGPFYNSGARYETVQCLEYGSYLFTLIDTDYMTPGLILCYSELCGYSLAVNNETILSHYGYQEFSVIQKAFEITAPPSIPSMTPSYTPSDTPSNIPSKSPMKAADNQASNVPSTSPSKYPSNIPSNDPSNSPSEIPSNAPSKSPVKSSGNQISSAPSNNPSDGPSSSPVKVTANQSSNPPSAIPSNNPSNSPSNVPSKFPVKSSENQASTAPSISNSPSSSPSASDNLSNTPSSIPSNLPSSKSSQTSQISEPLSMSIKPSASPSITVSVDLDWTLEYEKLALFDNKTNILDGLYLEYRVAKKKSSEQLVSYILDENCESKSNDTSIKIERTVVQLDPNFDTDKGIVTVSFNTSLLKNSPFWNALSSQSGMISFCVLTELLFSSKDSGSPISGVQTKLHEIIDYDSEFDSSRNTSISKIEVASVEQSNSHDVSGCICEVPSSTCLQENVTLHQNSQVNICVFSPGERLRVSSFQEVLFYQDGIAKFAAVQNGVSNPLTTTITSNNKVGIVSTPLLYTFFENPNPSTLTIKGEVALGFTSRRSLEENIMPADLLNDKRGGFKIDVDLKPRTEYMNYTVFFLLILSVISTFNFIKRKARKVVSYTRLQENDISDVTRGIDQEE